MKPYHQHCQYLSDASGSQCHDSRNLLVEYIAIERKENIIYMYMYMYNSVVVNAAVHVHVHVIVSMNLFFLKISSFFIIIKLF